MRARAVVPILVVVVVVIWLLWRPGDGPSSLTARPAEQDTPEPAAAVTTPSPSEREVAAIMGFTTGAPGSVATTMEDIEATASVAATIGFFAAFKGFFTPDTVAGSASHGIGAQILEPLILGLMTEAGLDGNASLVPLTVFAFAWKCSRTTDDGGAGCVQGLQDIGRSVAEMLARELVLGGNESKLRGYAAKVAQFARNKLSSTLLQAANHPEIARVVGIYKRAQEAMRGASRLLGTEAVAKRIAERMARVTRLWTKVLSVTNRSIATHAAKDVTQQLVAKQLTKSATRLTKAANVAALLLEVAVDVTAMLMDKFCVGNFSRDCHVDSNHVSALSKHFVQQFDTIVPLKTLERASIMYKARVSDATVRETTYDFYQNAVQMMVNDRDIMFKLTNFRTVRDWVNALESMSYEKQLQSLMGVKVRLVEHATMASKYAAEKKVCEQDARSVWMDEQDVCSVRAKTCCARVRATDEMYRYAGASSDAAKALVAASKLVAYALQDEMWLLVDVFEAALKHFARQAPLTPSDFGAWIATTKFGDWLRAEAERDDDVELVGLEHTVRLATARALALKHGYMPKSKESADALLRACHAELTSSADLREAVLDAEAMSESWPSIGREDTDAYADIRFLRSYPPLLALSYRWHDAGNTSEARNDGCVGDENRAGYCVPDRAAMLDKHVCRFLKAGQQQKGLPGAADESTAPDGDVRNFANDGKLGHVVDWNRSTCAVSTEYCERYELYPTLDGNVDEGCTPEEVNSRRLNEYASFRCVTACMLAALPSNAIECGVCKLRGEVEDDFPARQCESVRRLCEAGDSRCRCARPPYTEAFTANQIVNLGETLPAGVLAMIRGTAGDVR